jgi:hypothetical protein
MSSPVAVPSSGKAYRVLIERVLNQKIQATASTTTPGHWNIKIPNLHDPVFLASPDSVFAQSRIDSLMYLGTSAVNAQAQLQSGFPAPLNGTPHPGATEASATPYQKIFATMNALTSNGLTNVAVVLYHSVRALVIEMIDHHAGEAFKAGWKACRTHHNMATAIPAAELAALNTKASNYDATPGAISHNSY